ncbi:TrkH family potassium uptake protein [Pelosinus propionicus]|uniref:Trk system potassium uptake protein TrkH n=1 Tax=Pelosinus propionicus DSM 13327 TaxID=1123291 RepID=A0A1I4P6E2_9FIRM|nr:TrkH family potassium uptake protein [Pelosinus propionicus]SFM23176.1 trk system potassium uptake protein TrkH [Pelosinus propionicus DSM 13327]
MRLRNRFANLLHLSAWKFTPYQILALGFAGLIMIGTLLLMMPITAVNGQGLSLVDALFTATSAVCITGLVVVDTGSHFNLFGQSVIIFLIQIGGLGIMTMATLMALVIGRKIQLRERLVMQEALNHMTVAGVVRLTQSIIISTLVIEFIGGTILAIRWYPDLGLTGIYFGYWHAVSSFCNAGFDLFGNFHSLTNYVDDTIINLTVTSLIILGGLGFTVIFDVWNHRKWQDFSLHTKLVLFTTIILLALGTLVILLLEINNPATLGTLSWKGKILASYFQSVTLRSAGYNTVSVVDMQDATIFFMVILMFIGAAPTSTGGGIKVTTMSILIAAVWALIRGKNDAEIFQRRISQRLIYKAFTLVFLSTALVVIVTMMMSIIQSESFLKILFEVVSAFATVGLSLGITSTLTMQGKIVMIITMFAGRVGLVTLALALALRTKRAKVQYPEGKIIIG